MHGGWAGQGWGWGWVGGHGGWAGQGGNTNIPTATTLHPCRFLKAVMFAFYKKELGVAPDKDTGKCIGARPWSSRLANYSVDATCIIHSFPLPSPPHPPSGTTTGLVRFALGVTQGAAASSEVLQARRLSSSAASLIQVPRAPP
jgi:hypothetical protein